MLGRGCWLALPLLWVVGALTGGPEGYRRKLSLEYNPGLNASSVNLLHIRAVGINDTIHYIWSTIGAPTALLVYTRSNSSALRVNWTKLFSLSPSGAIQVEPAASILYSKAVIFAKVFEFSSVNTSDLSKAPPESFYPTYNLANFSWDSLGSQLNQSTTTVTFRGVPSEARGTFGNGSISFRVTAYEESSRDNSLPCLLHTANSSKVEFLMRGVAARGNHSRFALEIITVEEKGERQRLDSIRSIDDEYTPTIFEMAQLVSVPSNGSAGSSFLQWKTVAYSSQHAQREDTVHCQYSPLQTANLTVPRASIAHAYFQEALDSSYGVAAINISFGSGDHEAYQENGYLSWSALIGFGKPSQETFSPLVIAILAVALGTPAVLLVAGSVAVLATRKKQDSEYEPIN